MSYIRYKIEKQQVSYDSGVTWFDTSVTRNGDYAGTYSTLPECETGGDTSYSGQYFTIESAVDNNVVKFSSYKSKTISASTDGGSTWSGYTASGSNKPTIATLNMGQKVLIKGLNSTYYYITGNTGYVSDFNVSGNYIVYGNIMSLIYGDSFATATTLTVGHCFKNFFASKENLISAENLVLPATVLTEWCYGGMFGWCSNLTTAPSVLPATTLANACYAMMFHDCTSLTGVPQLPATTLANGCYAMMFSKCTSLTAAPVLSATTLANECYAQMFEYCSSLMSAPQLPAATLVEDCYSSMFLGCTSLSHVTCLATYNPSVLGTGIWLYNVSPTGTFVKAASMTGWQTGYNGIPEGWTIQNA